MKAMKRGLAKLLVLTFAVSMVIGTSACGSSKSDATPSASAGTATTAATATPAPAKNVEIAFWEQDDPGTVDPTWKELINDFMTKNPNIKVTMTHSENEALRTNYQNAVAAGEGPAIVSGPDDNLGVFGTASTAMPLDDVFSKEFLATLNPKALDSVKLDGKLYGIPYRIGNCLALLYNKKLVTKVPQTMDELYAMSKDFTKAGKQYGLVFNTVEPFFYVPFLGGFDGKVMDEKGNITLDTPAMKSMTQLIYDILFTQKISPVDANYDVASNLFKEGKAMFIINGPWAYNEYTKAGIDLGITNMPKTSAGKYPAPYTASKVFVLNPNMKADQKDAAKKLVEFFSLKDNQLKMAKATQEFPTNLEALKDPYVTGNEQMKALAAQMEVGTPMPIVPKMRAVWDGMKPVFAELRAGKIKPEDAPKKMQASAEEKAKAMLGTK